MDSSVVDRLPRIANSYNVATGSTPSSGKVSIQIIKVVIVVSAKTRDSLKVLINSVIFVYSLNTVYSL